MRTISFKINNPFMCHAGQFEEGRTLVIGIRKAFLDEDAILNITVGGKVYKALTTELRTLKTTPHKAKGGVALEIMPLYYFEIISEPKKEEKKEEITKEITQGTLL